MTVIISVLWKMNIHMAKKWPEKFVQRSFIKEHSFPYSLYEALRSKFSLNLSIEEVCNLLPYYGVIYILCPQAPRLTVKRKYARLVA